MKRVCVALVLSMIVGLVAPAPASAASSADIPLILISEPVKAGQAKEDDSVWAKSGLLSKLRKMGYETGVSLFLCTPECPYHDLDSGAVVISDMLKGVMKACGSNSIQVAAYGVSGLVLRFCLDEGYIEDGLIKDAIMLTAPQRGSFMSSFLFDILQIVKHESIFEQATRQSRLSPFGDIGDPSTAKVASVTSTGDLPMAIGTERFTWEGETWWVSKRASEIYEPLYSMYVKNSFLSIPFVPKDSPKETFQGWIKTNRPILWDNCVVQRQSPPLGTAGGLQGMPVKGQDLTTAYYEILAMDVARNQYVMRTASKGSLVSSLFSDMYVPTGFQDALIHYGSKALIHYAKKALVTVKAEIQKFLTGSIVRATDYLDDPESPFLRRLVKEDVLVNLGTSITERFARIKANSCIGTFNNKSLARSASRKTRYVSLTGKVTNIAGIIWPQVGPNNFFCEVDSAVAPQGPKDVVKVFSGVLSPSYLDLLKDKRVQESFIEVLTEEPGRVIEANQGISNEIQVSSWYPTYVTAPAEGLGHRVFQATVDVSTPPDGWGYLVWTEGFEGTDWQPLPGGVELVRSGKQIKVVLANGLQRVGVRLERTDITGPSIAGGKPRSVFEKELTTNISAGIKGVSNEEIGGGGLEDRDDEGSGSFPPLDWPEHEIPDNQVELIDGIPSVRVVYRNKHTTLRKAEEIYHEYWEIDFGDGQSTVVHGQPELVLSHFYQNPGLYIARFESYDKNGKLLLQKTDQAQVGFESGNIAEFRCTSVQRPVVQLLLSGPIKWVTGKYALYTGDVTLDLPKNAQVVHSDSDPGKEFQVLWERSGDFKVFWAVTLTLDYYLEGQIVTVKNTYVEEMDVDVFTPGIVK